MLTIRALALTDWVSLSVSPGLCEPHRGAGNEVVSKGLRSMVVQGTKEKREQQNPDGREHGTTQAERGHCQECSQEMPSSLVVGCAHMPSAGLAPGG